GPGPEQPAPAPEPTSCMDGTLLASCSGFQPYYCSSEGEIISAPSLCGCPDGTAFSGTECVVACADGTPLASCAEERPMYCTQDAKLVRKPSDCGCPDGTIYHNGDCISTCTDGTNPGACSSTRPYHCNNYLALVPDLDKCGCQPGTALVDGSCVAAKCIDDTPVGGCTKNPPNYCNEQFQIVPNPAVCGCPIGRIPNLDRTLCVNPLLYPRSTGETFEIANAVTMKVLGSRRPACTSGEYVIVELEFSNNGLSPFSLGEADITLLQKFEGSSHKWHAIQYPANNSFCNERYPFEFGEIPPGGNLSGRVWFTLLNWDGRATYYLYHKDKHVRLSVR
ncbi:MAG TPA: hypothetical protein PKJ97_03785, partial [Candidatus Bilamarchaeaceae archaeon]|nr:hypothetical protein [Candidatus Bilamarchaeaceae archaeon]